MAIFLTVASTMQTVEVTACGTLPKKIIQLMESGLGFIKPAESKFPERRWHLILFQFDFKDHIIPRIGKDRVLAGIGPIFLTIYILKQKNCLINYL